MTCFRRGCFGGVRIAGCGWVCQCHVSALAPLFSTQRMSDWDLSAPGQSGVSVALWCLRTLWHCFFDCILPLVWQTFNVPLSWYMSISPWFKGAHAHEKIIRFAVPLNKWCILQQSLNKIMYVLRFLDKYGFHIGWIWNLSYATLFPQTPPLNVTNFRQLSFW